jgi:hypothetical protein
MSVNLSSQGQYSAGVPVRARWRELYCPPIHAMATARRCRLYIKAKHNGTFFACPAWATQRDPFLQQAIGDIQARLREVHTRAVVEQRLEYQHLDEEEWNLLRELLGGQSFGDVLPNHLAPGNRSEWWNCPEPKRQEHVKTLISFVHAILPVRGPVIRTLIATQSQNRNR